MNNNNNPADSKMFSANMIDAAIKIIAIILIGTWCFDILKPFIMPMAWGAILAIALFPFYKKLVKLCGNKKGLAAGVFAVIGIAILVIPTIAFSTSAVDSITQVSEGLKEGMLWGTSVFRNWRELRDWGFADRTIGRGKVRNKPGRRSEILSSYICL